MSGARPLAVSLALVIASLLTSCDKPSNVAVPGGHHGRYAGIGTFAAGVLWSKMIADTSKDDRAATIADDEHVIVVVDTDTGEIRECGDYSGRCVSMNPWTKAIAGPQPAPVRLTNHAADLQAQAEAEQSVPHATRASQNQ